MITRAEIEKLGPERGVLGVRPHVRPLLLARQRCSVPDRASPDVTWWSEVPAAAPSPRSWPCRPSAGPAVGLAACLAAVSGGPVQTLVVPADGLVPGYECRRCGTLSLDADTCCPDWASRRCRCRISLRRWSAAS